MQLDYWAMQWGISPACLRDLKERLAQVQFTEQPPSGGESESAVQAQARIEASRRGEVLWRNNVGAGHLENGSFVRWGLANESLVMNKSIKSADLIGIRPVLITPAHVGTTIGQFVSLECKAAGWKHTGRGREVGQDRWAEIVIAHGGHASYITGARDETK